MDGGEVAKHNTTTSCWIIIGGIAYDVTDYLEQHPGGASILLSQGGRDATTEFRRIHSPDVLQYLPPGSCLGPVDTNTLAALAPSQDQTPSGVLLSTREAARHISQCVTADDFEHAARAVLPARAWSYVSSFSNSGLSMAANLASWSSISFRPRILRNVRTVTTTASFLGDQTPFPFFVAPMGILGRAHDEAEAELVRGLVGHGVHAVISTMSTRTAEEIVAALRDGTKASDSKDGIGPTQLHFQLYTPPERAAAIKLIRRAREAGFRSLWVTVDTPVLGKRTIDRRRLAEDALAMGLEEQAAAASLGIRTHVPPNQISSSLGWEDIRWIKDAWCGPLVIKGIQCAEDATLAMEYGCQGILLSNHGGRQLHSAPDSLSTLLEIREYCPEVLEKLEVYVDGGLRDGADVLKAVCLGATGVGVGRPFFYALAAHGAKGVERCIDILAEELETAMRLVGLTSLDKAHPDMVNASGLRSKLWQPLKGRL